MQKLIDNLEKTGYKVSVFDTKELALEYMAGEIKNTTVGIGGSMTVLEMGLYEKLLENNRVYWHWKAPDGMTANAVCEKASDARIYVSSVNGISQTGEIINIDGSGNRVSSIIYGHKKVYFVVGQNKIAPDFEKALERARNIASPLNAKRLGCATPCAAKGDKCYNCSSPERICRAFTVLAEKPKGCEYEVVLIKENLGY